MEIGETLYLSEREDWRAWLEAHFEEKNEVWLVYPKAGSGRPRIAYNDAVEEALCFGWIDSIVKALDEEYSVQRFSRRKPGSPFSQPNKERLAWLAARRRLHPNVQETVAAVLAEPFVFPEDILAAIRDNETAWKHYEAFSPGYRRIRIAYIKAARKRPEEFEKRLQHFIKMTADNKQIRGYGGIDKYY